MQLSSNFVKNYQTDSLVIDKKKKSDKFIWLVILEELQISNNTELISILGNAKFIEIKNNILYFAVGDSFSREKLVRNHFSTIKNIANEIDSNIKMISVSVDSAISDDNKIHTQKNKYCNEIFSKINSKFTFDNFITADSNILAYKIMKNIAFEYTDTQKSDLCNFHSNVFYIYSYVGMGKTHLLQSIINEVSNKDTNNKLGYLTAEKFMHNFIKAVKSNTLFDLRSKVSEVDIFLIDDLQFICGKESTQKEFAYVLNLLIESGKKIIIASSVPNHMLELDDERTKSILRSSNAIYIEPCEYDLRIKILENYNNKNNVGLDNSTLRILADKVTASNRELEASINNLKTYLHITGRKPTTDNVNNYIKSYVNCNKKRVSTISIINATAKYYRLSKPDIISKKRSKKLVIARQIISYLSKELTTDSLKLIGERIGDRDHSTVLYYINKLESQIKKDDQVLSDISNIKSSISATA